MKHPYKPIRRLAESQDVGEFFCDHCLSEKLNQIGDLGLSERRQ